MAKSEKVRSVHKIADDGIPCIAICAGKHCAKAGTKQLVRAMQQALEEQGLATTFRIELSKCQDNCDDAPCLTTLPDDYPYVELEAADSKRIVCQHLCLGQPVLDLLEKKARKKLEKKLKKSA